jgi:hypothetical protein
MHREIKEGDHVMVLRTNGEKARTIVSYSGDVYFTAGGIRYRKSNGATIWTVGPFSVATPDTGEQA